MNQSENPAIPCPDCAYGLRRIQDADGLWVDGPTCRTCHGYGVLNPSPARIEDAEKRCYLEDEP